jgi:hypothetical protein
LQYVADASFTYDGWHCEIKNGSLEKERRLGRSGAAKGERSTATENSKSMREKKRRDL